ncbi:LysR family transcriptional regulator [Thalassotalea sp. LPB0316]|uniref:LysR family transcriptional regulator n=1 Tax=Thalassotalea sp. LPB0316 TaxID=2769490 RepID=UPI00186678E6|nr:LysR family transcriptional regulator [Thalassotalea sp. LPB0316]QOL25807.1 LysR family transcriptional regulator [Thalassotalea sp. LPB0316]
MHLEQLRLFAELVNYGSYTKTADALGVSKAYVSKQIKVLEQNLHCQLLVRNTRSMRLTPAGETLNQRVQTLTSFWQETKQLIKHQEDELEGLVRYTAPTGLMQTKLFGVIEHLHQHFPAIELLCETGNQTHNLVSEPYDFAIRITNTPPQDMVAIKLMTSDYICCASPKYLKRCGVPSSPQALANFRCITLAYWRNWAFSKAGKYEEISIEPHYQFSDNLLLKQAALASLGITRLPKYLIEQELANGQLVSVLSDFDGESRDVYLLYPQDLNRPERVKKVLSVLKQHFIDS